MSLKHELFPSPIWGFYWKDEAWISKVLEYTTYLVSTKASVSKSNSLGWQSHDFMHQEPLFAPFTKQLLQVVNSEVLPECGGSPFEIDALWINVNFPNACNMAHIHDHALSGVYYLSIPTPAKDSGRLVFIDPRQRVSMSTARIKSLNYPVVPDVGACIIFPSWLEHYVEPNRTQEVRISISFNLK